MNEFDRRLNEYREQQRAAAAARLASSLRQRRATEQALSTRNADPMVAFGERGPFVLEFVRRMLRDGMPGSRQLYRSYPYSPRILQRIGGLRPSDGKPIRGYAIGAEKLYHKYGYSVGKYPVYLCEDERLRVAKAPAPSTITEVEELRTQNVTTGLFYTGSEQVEGHYGPREQSYHGFQQLPIEQVVLNIASTNLRKG